MRKRADYFGLKRTLIFIFFLLMGISALPVMASALPEDNCSATENEEQQEILWQGDVTLTNGTTITVTAHNSGIEHEVNGTTALGALDAAAIAGAFNFTVTDEWGILFADSIADVAQEGWSGWIYWVNYPAEPMPMVGSTDYLVEDGDVVTWYWSSSMEMTPAKSPLLVIINVSVSEPRKILWQGDVTLTNGTMITVTAHNSGIEHEVNGTTALGALDAAATAGTFNFTVTDEWSFLFADSIADVAQEGWSGWIYWVNYPAEPMPMVGSTDYLVEDGDVVTWYWSSSMEMTPAKSPLLLIINVSVTEDPASPTPDPTPEPTPTPSPRRSGGGGAPRDADSDGYSDIKELLAETNPNDPTDYPGKVSAEVTTMTLVPSSTPLSTPAPTPTATPLPTSFATTSTPAASTATLQSPGFDTLSLILELLATAYLIQRRMNR